MKELLSKINKLFDDDASGLGDSGPGDKIKFKNYILKYLGDVAASDVEPDKFELDDDA